MTVRNDGHGQAVQAARPYSSQTIAIGAGSVACNAFQTGTDGRYSVYTPVGVPLTAPNNTRHIRVVATSDCWISFGANPVAVAAASNAILLPAGIPEYFWVVPGERIACIQATAAGSLNIAELVN
jgi:hypothetical protein